MGGLLHLLATCFNESHLGCKAYCSSPSCCNFVINDLISSLVSFPPPFLIFVFSLLVVWLVVLSLLFDNFALDMKRNASGMFLEDSDDSNRDSGEFSRFWIAPR